MSEVGPDFSVSSLVSGERRLARPRKVVDASYMKFSVPSARSPQYGVASGAACVPPNDLPRVRPICRGRGRKERNGCLHLAHGERCEPGPDPLDHAARLLDVGSRRRPTREGVFAPLARSVADQVDALAKGRSIDDVFARLEASGVVKRIDVTIKPTAYHCAVVGQGELELLRRVRDIVRLGRVIRIDADQIVLERGAVPANPGLSSISTARRRGSRGRRLGRCSRAIGSRCRWCGCATHFQRGADRPC